MSALTNKQKFVLAQMARRAFNLEGAKMRGRHLTPALSPRGGEGETVSASAGVFCGGRHETLQEALRALAANGGSDGCFETWRHEPQVKLACGKNGLRLCSQLDYKAVERHFQQLLGEDGRAFKADQRWQSEPRRQAESILVKACARHGFHLSYADAICRSVHGMSLDDAETPVIWKVIYTVNNRGGKRKRAALAATRRSPHPSMKAG